MSVTPESFRKTFRAFADLDNYPDLAIQFWVSTATVFLAGSTEGATNGGARWGDKLDYGTMLFVAHHLVLDARDAAAVAAGGIPGDLKGPATSKSVDKVAVSYDTKAVTFEDEAFWNSTRFGVQLLNVARMVGAGGMQIGAPCAPPGTIWQ